MFIEVYLECIPVLSHVADLASAVEDGLRGINPDTHADQGGGSGAPI